MIKPGQICRDRACKTFRIVIVLSPSQKAGKLRVCRWQPSPNPSAVDGRWSPPCAMSEDQLEPLPDDFDLTLRRGLIVAAARRSVIDGNVRWQVGGPGGFTELHHVGKVQP
jgi:hypothetical protein